MSEQRKLDFERHQLGTLKPGLSNKCGMCNVCFSNTCLKIKQKKLFIHYYFNAKEAVAAVQIIKFIKVMNTSAMLFIFLQLQIKNYLPSHQTCLAV